MRSIDLFSAAQESLVIGVRHLYLDYLSFHLGNAEGRGLDVKRDRVGVVFVEVTSAELLRRGRGCRPQASDPAGTVFHRPIVKAGFCGELHRTKASSPEELGR